MVSQVLGDGDGVGQGVPVSAVHVGLQLRGVVRERRGRPFLRDLLDGQKDIPVIEMVLPFQEFLSRLIVEFHRFAVRDRLYDESVILSRLVGLDGAVPVHHEVQRRVLHPAQGQERPGPDGSEPGVVDPERHVCHLPSIGGLADGPEFLIVLQLLELLADVLREVIVDEHPEDFPFVVVVVQDLVDEELPLVVRIPAVHDRRVLLQQVPDESQPGPHIGVVLEDFPLRVLVIRGRDLFPVVKEDRQFRFIVPVLQRRVAHGRFRQGQQVSVGVHHGVVPVCKGTILAAGRLSHEGRGHGFAEFWFLGNNQSMFHNFHLVP